MRLVTLVPVLTLLFLMPHQYRSAEEMAWLSSRVQQAHTAAMSNITDIKTIAATLSHPLLMDNKNLVATYQGFLKQHQLGFHNHDHSKLFGKQFQLKKTSTACNTKVIRIEEINLKTGHYRVHGVTDNQQRKEPLNDLLMIDNNNRIIGIARRHRVKGYFLPLSYHTSTQQWLGYINNGNAGLDFPVRILGQVNQGYCQGMTINAAEFQKLTIN